MEKTCEACGRKFETKTTGKYCIDCRYIRYGFHYKDNLIKKGGKNEKSK